jgi:hypothetical protein
MPAYRLATGWTGPVIESRWGGGRFPAAVHTAPGAHQASCKMGTGYLSMGVKRPGRGVDQPPNLLPRLKKECSITLLPLWAFMAFSSVKCYFTHKYILCAERKFYLIILKYQEITQWKVSGRYLTWGTIPFFVWRYWRQQTKTKQTMVRILADFSNKSIWFVSIVGLAVKVRHPLHSHHCQSQTALPSV